MNDPLLQKIEALIQEVLELSDDLKPKGSTPIDTYSAGFSLGLKLPVIALKRLLKETDEPNPH